MKISFEKRFLFIFLLIAAAVLAFSLLTYHNNKTIAESNYRVAHTHQVLYRTARVLSDLKDLETGVSGYIITRDTNFLAPYYQSKDSIIANIEKLGVLTKDNAGQQPRIDTLRALAIKRIGQWTQILKIPITLLVSEGRLMPLVRDGKRVMDKIRKSVAGIEQEENRLLVIRENINTQNYEKIKTRLYIFFGGLILLFVLAFFVLRYNFSILKRDSKSLFQLNNRLSFLNKRVDDIIEGISDPFFALDKDFKFIYLNTAAEKKIGIQKSGLIGKDIFKVFPDYNGTVIGQNMLKVQQTQEPLSFEAYDEVFQYWEDLTIYPTDEGLTIYIRDATARKASERELLRTKKFLEETNEVATIGGWEVDLVRSTVYWTPVTRMIHETEPDFIPDLDSGIGFYKQGESRDLVTGLISDAIKKGTEWDAELQIITARGNERWVRTKAKTEFEDGRCVRIVGTFQDIDAQKRLEQKLQQSEKQFRSAFEYSAIGMALVSSNGSWKEVNESLCRMIGYTQAELFKLSFTDVTHPEDLQHDLDHLQELIKGTQQSYQLEKRYLHKDGHVVWGLLTVSMVKDENGDILHFIAQIQDISEKKQAEKELVEERQLLRTIIDNVPLNVYLKDLESKKILINKSELEYVGAESETAILGKNDFDLYPYDSAIISREEDKEVFETGLSIIDKETVSFKKDGTETWFLTSKIPFKNAEDEIIGLLGISYDITVRNQIKNALQASEQKLSTLFDLSPVGFVLNDYKTGEFLEFNNSFIDTLGYNREELAALSYQAITPKEYWYTEDEIHRSVSETGYFGPLEKQYIKKDGSRYPALLNGLKITDGKGRELIWTVVQDITELKMNEIELKQLNVSIEEQNKELAVKNEELEQFAYVASHDLQEPLRMVTGFLSKIERKYNPLLDEEGKKYIHFAVDGAIRMRNLITDILNYSSLNGSNEATNTAVDLNTVVQIIAISLQPGKDQQKADIETDELPVIMADKTSVQQLFSNLISNAIKYQKPGNKPVVKVKVEDNKSHWKFSVADNGIGIDPKFFHKVFNVFQRLHTKEQYSGTGIGLAICKKIVNNLKGEIWLDSRAGEGTTFYFTIRK